MVGATDVIPWIALIGAAGSAAAVARYYQDRSKAREDRAKFEQALADRVAAVERDLSQVKADASEAHGAATASRGHAELARQELHQAQLTFAREYVSKRDLGDSEERLVSSMDQLRVEVHGLRDLLHQALFVRTRRNEE